MGRRDENAAFRCACCQREVRPLTNGSYRNHCPFCLASRHVDVVPGDRASPCGGIMDAVAIRASRRGWQLLHRCRRCGAARWNRTAEQTVQSDDIEALIAVMARRFRATE